MTRDKLLRYAVTAAGIGATWFALWAPARGGGWSASRVSETLAWRTLRDLYDLGTVKSEAELLADLTWWAIMLLGVYASWRLRFTLADVAVRAVKLLHRKM